MKLKPYWNNFWAVVRARWYFRKATVLGPRARVWGRPSVQNQGIMQIGERLRLVSTITPCELVSGPQGRLEIGDGVFINYGCSIAASQFVCIGANSLIGTYAILMDNDFHAVDPDQRNQQSPSAPIILEENVWLGARVTVLKGVTIGRDSVIGAGSVVTRDIPPGCLAAGVPARVIRQIKQKENDHES